MKIISKHKDYYDYLQGIYGIDNLLAYNRGEVTRVDLFEEPFSREDINEHKLAIGGDLYAIFEHKGKLYHSAEDLKVLSEITRKKHGGYVWSDYNKPTDINIKRREPVLFNSTVPLLKDFKFARWYPPEEIYHKIVAFMGHLKDHPEIPNKQTNIEKLESHGFDKKISFRHRK